ncbi:spore coat protein CotH [Clostridium sp. AF19-22AC]|jgi:spore coat protein CotH|uniref:CotH kinase family protein n=1 Tax=Clostridia TaxID=186801 RepID=UPI000E4C5BFB|nr:MULTISPECIES: CotH kinase family protein [Clostridia]RHR29970.1 spore coat protein CotH [Clostridium sp. AF19-22AC]
MSTHRHIDKICCAVLLAVFILTAVFCNAEALGVETVSSAFGYEGKLFDTSSVHTIDIVMDDWDGFLETCTNEEYTICAVVIDNEAYKNVGIRAKGNTSLSSVAAYGNDRYSFKIEFDHYDDAKTYYGLDKISLNNIIQDNTYMKDYLSYQMMGYFGVDAPLCSYANITVNGEEWGLYLAVEGVEESFLTRNYGSDYGELYKPDSISMGGGRGNGGGFDMEDFEERSGQDGEADTEEDSGKDTSGKATPGGGMKPGGRGQPEDGTLPDMDDMPDTGTMPEKGAMPDMGNMPGDGAMPDMGDIPEDGTMPEMGDMPEDGILPEMGDMPGNGAMPANGGGMGMGSDDVSLIYSDDDQDSYSNIFDNAKTKVSDADKERLIESLKILNEGGDIESVVDVDEVIRYFVVHNFVCNFDSYTGSMIHNYYLYEEDGVMSMIPWDYNLAFGGFMSGSDAESLVNYPIDTPVSGGTVESRPMLAWIFKEEAYTEMYHEYFAEFISEYFDSGYFEEMIDSVSEMIAPYVENDPTKFCTYEEFEEGVSTLKEFCLLRAESINGQLDGTIPSTSDGQGEDDSALIDAGDIEVSAMGSMGNMMGMGGSKNKGR